MKDFTLFLKLRAKELVPDGRMVVSLVGRRSDELVTEITHVRGTTAQVLGVMASEVNARLYFCHLLTSM